MGMPDQHIIIETSKQDFNYWAWILGILGATVSAVLVEFFRRKIKK